MPKSGIQLLTFMTFLALLPSSAFAAPASFPVTLQALLEHTDCPEGQPVILTLALHNNGSDSLLIGYSAFEASSFQFTVTDSRGRTVPRTADGERVLTPPMAAFRNASVIINPQQTLPYRFNLARLFDVSRAGTYTVRVGRSLRPEVLKPGQSDALTPTVTLSGGPLAFRMVNNAAADSGLVAFVPAPASQTFLYMGNRYDAGIGRYRIGEDGSVSFVLNPVQPAPDPLRDKKVDSITVSRDGHFLYGGSADSNSIYRFRMGDDGTLFALSPPVITLPQLPDMRLSETNNRLPMQIGVIDPTRTYLKKEGGIGYRAAFDGKLGTFDSLSEGVVGKGNVNSIALSPNGKYAYAGVSTDNGSAFFDRVQPLRVGENGNMTALSGGLTPQAPPLPWPGFQPFQCSMLAVDPTGQFLVVLNPGFLDTYGIGSDGLLTPLGMTKQQGQMTSIFFGPARHIVYVLNENPPALLAFRLDDKRGLVDSGLAMPTHVPFAASIASAVVPTPLHWGQAAGGLAMSVRLPADVQDAGTPVVLTVLLKNITTHSISLGMSGADMASFRLLLTGPQRQSPGFLSGPGEQSTTPASLLAASRDILGTPHEINTPLLLRPGGIRQYRFVLSRLSDMTVAGNYTVQISHIAPGGTKAMSPVLHLLLTGPFNGVTQSGNGIGLSIL